MKETQQISYTIKQNSYLFKSFKNSFNLRSENGPGHWYSNAVSNNYYSIVLLFIWTTNGPFKINYKIIKQTIGTCKANKRGYLIFFYYLNY